MKNLVTSLSAPLPRTLMAVAVLVASQLLLTACNTRFRADFESDALGSPPPASPPGSPDDEIVIFDLNTDDDGIVIRVTDEPGLVPDGEPHRFMSLMRETDPGQTSVASLRTAELATSTQSIYAQWEQVLDGGGSGLITIVALPDGPLPDDPETCRVLTGNDQITIECASGVAGLSEEIDGIDTHSVHTVLMRIDRSPHRVVLEVSQSGSATAAVAIESDEVPAPAEGDRLAFQIEHDGQSDSAYRFNRFDVQERDPN